MKYRKKPVVIEAFQFDGDFMDSSGSYYVPEWAVKALEMGTMQFGSEEGHPSELFINTLEGQMHVKCLDWIIKGVKGELYPCKPDIFEATYEKVDP